MSDTHQAENEGQGGAPPDPAPDIRPQQEQQQPEGEQKDGRTRNERGEFVKAEPEAEPPKQDWRDKEIAAKHRQNQELKRVLSLAEQELQKYRPPPDPAAPQDVETLAMQRAQQLVAEREYNDACNASHDAGMATFPDFGEAMGNLANVGCLSRAVLEAALEVGEAHKILYQLGKDPGEAIRISGLTPARMGVALAKLAAKPVAPPAVTRAPSPVRSIGGGSAKPADDPERMSMAEFTAWRERNLAAKRAG